MYVSTYLYRILWNLKLLLLSPSKGDVTVHALKLRKKISKKTKPYKTIANNCWRSPFQPLKGHLTIPKRSPRIATQDTFAQPGRGTGHKWTSNTCEAVRVAADADPKSLGIFFLRRNPYLLGALQVRFFMTSRYIGERMLVQFELVWDTRYTPVGLPGFSRLAGWTPRCQRRMNIEIWWIGWEL